MPDRAAEILAYENIAFDAELEPMDFRYLRSVLGGSLHIRGTSFIVVHTVGHVVMPSGRILRIRSKKAPAASVLAWSAFVDPRIGDLRILGEATRVSQEADVAALLAKLFLAELTRVIGAHGLARTYRKTQTASATVRGRIDFIRLARRAGDASRVPCEIWERRPHSMAMRMLAATLKQLAADPVMRAVDPALLHSLRLLFADVPPHVEPQLLAARATLPRNEQPFSGAVALARLVLRHVGLGEGGEHAGVSYLVALDLLFERAVVRALQENGVRAIPKYLLRHERVTREGHATSGMSPMELDAWCPSLAPGGVVIDAKYKDAISSANLQQMLAYCSLSGARQGVLAVPSGLIADQRSYRFRPLDAEPVVIHIIELAVDGRDVATWRASAAAFARRVVTQSAMDRFAQSEVA